MSGRAERELARRSLKGAAAPGTPAATPQTGSEEETLPSKATEILCRHCLQAVTTTEERISVEGAHRHVFANPHGLVFEIGCFAWVFNCGIGGPASTEFSWFAGFAWQVVFCARCLTHLGWAFDSAAKRFHGLIASRLIEP